MKTRKLISAILAGVMALSSLTAAASAEGKTETVLQPYLDELEVLNEELGTSYELDGENLEEFFGAMTIPEFREYIITAAENDKASSLETSTNTSEAASKTAVSPRAFSNVYQKYYFSDDVNYLYIETTVQVFVETTYPIYLNFIGYGYGDTGVYPQYRPTDCEYTISDDQKSITCLFRLKKYTADNVTDSKRYRKTVTFYADGEYADSV